MRVALIDDEPDARATLRSLLKMELPSAFFQEADGVEAGLNLIQQFQPEVVFLDVMMKDGTGFDLLRQLSTMPFKLIIVSGHDEFALKAFRFSAIDYLVKPVDADELHATLGRLQAVKNQEWQQVMNVLRQGVHANKDPDRKLILKDMNAIYVVSTSSIIRCEASDNYTTFYLTDQSPIVVSKPLKEYDELLAPLQFLRVHQSHLINLRYLQQFNRREGGSIKMKDGSEVPVSSRKREMLISELSRLQ